jgi:hypothetical protein
MPDLTLERVLRDLHDSGINAGVQTFFDVGMHVWIGDDMNEVKASTTIARLGVPGTKRWPINDAAARWLHETALCLNPDSRYAQNHGHERASLRR